MNANARRLRFLPRFSLRTLLLAVLLFASGFGLHEQWEPWVVDYPGPNPGEIFDLIVVAPDGQKAVAYRYEPQGPQREHQSPERLKGQFVVDLYGASTPRLLEASEAEEALHPVFSRDGRFIAGTNKSGMTVWRTDTGKIEHFIPLYLENDNIPQRGYGTYALCRFAEFLPDGNTVIATSDQSIYRIDLRHQTFKRFIVDPPSVREAITGFRISPDGTRILRYREHELPKVYDIENPVQPLLSVQMRNTADGKYWEFEDGRFSADSLRVMGICQRKYLRICDAHTGALLHDLWHDTPRVYDLAESPDGSHLLVNMGGDGLVLWDMEDGVQRAHFQPGSWISVRFGDENRLIELLNERGGRTRYQRRRPEPWWGIAWLPESWLALVFGLGLLWSLVRDWKTIRAKDAAALASAR